MLKFFEWFISILPKPLQRLYHKYEDICLYVYFGALTTFLSIISQYSASFAMTKCGYDIKDFVPNALCTTFSWIVAVTFAFFTNKTYVFKSKSSTKAEFLKQAGSFYGARVVTYFLELGIMLLFVSILDWNPYLVKFFAQFLILLANYVFSKLVVFRKPTEETGSPAEK